MRDDDGRFEQEYRSFLRALMRGCRYPGRMTNGVEQTKSRGGIIGRRAVVGLLVAVVVVGVAILFFQRGNDHSRDVIYNGRSIESIAGDLVYPPGTPRYDEARAAILKLDDRALPGLSSIIRRGIPWPVRWFESYQGRMPTKTRNWIVRRFHPFEYRNVERGAIHAVGILGTNAASLAPTLGERFAKGDLQTRSDLVQVLPKVGPAIIPQIEPFLTAPDLRTRGLATFCFYQLGPTGADAAPSLVASLTGADANQRRLVAQTLGRMGARAFPVITNLLENPEPASQTVGLEAMSGMFPRYLKATPLILDKLRDPNLDVRLQAALLVTDWWPMPISQLEQKFDALPADHPSKTNYAKSIDTLKRDEPLLLSVLREGMTAEPSLRLRAARRLLALGEVDEALATSMRQLVANNALPTNQWNEANLLLNKMNATIKDEPISESDPHPRSAEDAKSPASTDQRPPGKSP